MSWYGPKTFFVGCVIVIENMHAVNKIRIKFSRPLVLLSYILILGDVIKLNVLYKPAQSTWL